MAEFGLSIDPYYQDVVDDNLPKQITHKTDHVEEGLARLIHQYADKPRIKLLLQIYLDRVQDLEDAIFSLIDNAGLDNATGWILAALGKVLVQPNPGLSDDDYRTLLRARIRVIRSNGKPEELLTILRLVFGGSADILYRESRNSILVNVRSTFGATNPSVVHTLLRQAKAGGVSITLTFNREPAATHMRFSSYAGATGTAGSRGLSSSVSPGGGGLVGSARGGV
jgi:hypothetical protein